MNYNVEKAFCFVKNDPKWFKKLLIPSLVALFSLVFSVIGAICMGIPKTSGTGMLILTLASFLIFVVMGFAVYGFSYQYGHDRIYNENAPLPEWKDFWSFFFIGFKASLGMLLYLLPVILLSFASFILEIKAKSSPDSFSLALYIVNMFYNLFYIFYILFSFLFCASFLKDFNIFAFLNYAKAYRMIKGNWKNYFIVVLLVLAVSIILNIASVLLILTIIGLIAAPFAIIYIQIVTMDLIAQFVVIEEDSKKKATD